MPLHQHQSFTVEEVGAEDARHGRHLFVHYAEIGALGHNCTFVHMNVLRDDEVEAIAGSGISIVWHPSNFICYGIGAHQRTRMVELYGRGINIAFGTDTAKYWSIGEVPFLGYLVTIEVMLVAGRVPVRDADCQRRPRRRPRRPHRLPGGGQARRSDDPHRCPG